MVLIVDVCIYSSESFQIYILKKYINREPVNNVSNVIAEKISSIENGECPKFVHIVLCFIAQRVVGALDWLVKPRGKLLRCAAAIRFLCYPRLSQVHHQAMHGKLSSSQHFCVPWKYCYLSRYLKMNE